MMQIPLSGPDISQREIELVNQVLSGRYLSIGPMVSQFEESIAAFCGRKHAIAVSSGTAALHLCMRAMNLQPGDRMITSPFSFVASANCILYERGLPVFVDVDPETLNMDVDRTAEAIERLACAGTPARGMVVVQIFGQACDMDPLLRLAEEHSLEIIEDACESVGSEYRGRPVGTFGHASTLAFYPNKQMTTGEGGMVLTDDDRWNELIKSMRNQGRDGAGTWLNHVRLGYNYRMDELSAALGVAQAERLSQLLERRDQVAAWYAEKLAGLSGIEIPQPAEYTTRMSWFVYVIRLAAGCDRERIISALAERGVPARAYFRPIHLQPYYREAFGYEPGDFPVTEEIAARTLALPFGSTLREEQVAYVCQMLAQVL